MKKIKSITHKSIIKEIGIIPIIIMGILSIILGTIYVILINSN